MARPRVLAGCLSLTLLAAWGHVWMALASAQVLPVPTESPATAIVQPLFDDDLRQSHVRPPKFDVHGNEVDDAVGEYRVDVQGEIYEQHSPETEVRKLGPAVG